MRRGRSECALRISSLCLLLAPTSALWLPSGASRAATDVMWRLMCDRVGAKELRIGLDVEVRPSQAKGSGVFALRALPAKQLVVRYTGILRTREDHRLIETPSSPNGYTFKLGTDFVIDASDESTSGWARFVNHSVRRRNCEVVPVSVDQFGAEKWTALGGALDLLESAPMIPTRPFAVYLETTEAVEAGQELLIDYGGDYWRALTSQWRLDPRRLAIDYIL